MRVSNPCCCPIEFMPTEEGTNSQYCNQTAKSGRIHLSPYPTRQYIALPASAWRYLNSGSFSALGGLAMPLPCAPKLHRPARVSSIASLQSS